MNDELPTPFGRLTPRPAPHELRVRVLDAVAHQLAPRSRPRWERVFAAGVAAALALGIGLNVWLQLGEEAWQARVYGPRPVSRAVAEVARAVASITDEQTGEWVQQQLSSAQSPPRDADTPAAERYEQLLHALTDSRENWTL